MEKEIKSIMADIFKIKKSEIDKGTSTDTLIEWDSLKHMVLITALEEKFGIRFTAEEIVEITTFPKIKEIIKKKLKK